MTMSQNIDDRELAKFRQGSGDLSTVAVTLEGDTGLLEGISYDDMQAEYPTITKEIYSYFSNTILVAQIEVTYTDSTKDVLLRVRRI